MEQPDLNDSAAEDAALSALLRKHAPPIADDGFSARVVAALPPPRRRIHWVPIAYGGGTLAGLTFVLAQVPSPAGIAAAGEQFAREWTQASTALPPTAVWLAVGATSIALAVAVVCAFGRRRLRVW